MEATWLNARRGDAGERMVMMAHPTIASVAEPLFRIAITARV
jgi:hypothetical protein